jgi:hypothetical protein
MVINTLKWNIIVRVLVEGAHTRWIKKSIGE